MDKYEELKLEIFESAECGEITESEKDSLLETLDNIYESTAYNRYVDKETEKYEKKKEELEKKIEHLETIKNTTRSDSVKKSIDKKIENLESEFRIANQNMINKIKKFTDEDGYSSKEYGKMNEKESGNRTKRVVRERNDMTPAKERETGLFQKK